MALFDVGPSQKKSRLELFDIKLWIYCSQPFSKKPATVPDISKLSSLFVACKDRPHTDEIASLLLKHEEQIL